MPVRQIAWPYVLAAWMLASGLLLAAPPAAAESCNGVQIAVSSSLNVRSGPGTSYSKIGSALNNQRYYKVSTASNGWIRIQFDSRMGYIHPDYAVQNSFANCKKITASNNLNIRSGPGDGYSVVGTAPNGSRWFKNSSSDSWTRIHYGGASRWGYSSYLADVGSTPPPPSGDDNVTDYDAVVTVTDTKLNVRSGPGTNYSVVGKVSNGIVVLVTHHNGSWRKIRWGAGSAYVHSAYIAQISSAAPNITNFKLNNGAAETSSRTITLSHTRSGAYPTQYRVSESSVFSGASWRTYSTPIRFTVSNRTGSHTVYFQVRDSHGRVSTRRSDSITYAPVTNAPCLGGVNCLPLSINSPDCWRNLNCTVDEINALTIGERTDWFVAAILRYGPAVGFADKVGNRWENNWFSNIFGVLQLVEEFKGAGKLGSAAFNLTDAFILNAIQNGLKYHLTGRHENFDAATERYAQGHWWREFFREAAKAQPSISKMRRYWGVAEQIATNVGRSWVFWTSGMDFTSSEAQLLLWVGDFYRHAVANKDKLAIRFIENFASFDPRESSDLVRFGRLLLNDAKGSGPNFGPFRFINWIETNIYGPIVQAGVPLALLTQFESWVCQDSWATQFEGTNDAECFDSPTYGTNGR